MSMNCSSSEKQLPRQQKLLNEQLERLNQIINHTPALIGYWDNQLINQFSNSAYSRWFGQSPNEIKGRHISQVLGEELYKSLLVEIDGVLKGKEQRYERYITDANTGKQIHTLTRYIPDIVDDKVKGFYVLGTDITDKKQLSDITHTKDIILECITNGVLLTDANNRISYVNPAFKKITGYSINDVLGKTLDILKPLDVSNTEYRKILVAITNKEADQGEVLVHHKDEGKFWCEITVNPIFDQVGNFSQFVYIIRDITNRKQLEAEKLASENLFRSLANAAPVMIWLSGVDTLCYWFNATWLAFTGRTMEQEKGNGWAEGVHSEDFNRCLEIYLTNFKQHLPFRMEYRLRRYDGEYRWIDDSGVPHFNYKGEFDGYIGSCIDVTDIRNSKVASDFLEYSQEIIFSTDLTGNIIDVNSRFLEVTGYQREELIGKHVRILKSGAHDKHFYTQLWTSIIETGSWNGEITNKNKQGKFYSSITTIHRIFDNTGQPIRYLAIASDITALVETRDQLKSLAYYDTLTNLPNRYLLMDRLRQAIARIKREGGYLAILYLDLDGFKQINDNYGHEAGDNVLMTVAQRMKQALRDTDTVARIGGDEFLVILPKFKFQNMYETPIKNLLKVISTPIIQEPLTFNVTASIGVSVYGGETAQLDVDINTLIKQADQAMYLAKQSGKNRYHFLESIAELRL